MGNYISYTRQDLMISAAMIIAWLMIRPFFVALSKKAEAKHVETLEAEARLNTGDDAGGSGSSNSARRKKLD
ncbi:hypothetical protein DFQ27_004444 [Actinomortierella ambigua]|uniref:Uncharacterized protein n=1 Tax=Actinomortierella ambigua TaxID=1343610 RepID=A0A9P6QJ00_9FUNG|nr:hypothetical protein DFQ26_008221 [Actinomortierella ambigua]KAG0269204.1 hypothetical protein DFQ27_004444 [Actinomortierella ambigua]